MSPEAVRQRVVERVSRRPAAALTRHYRTLFEQAPDGYLATDRGGTIREANRAAAALVRLPPEELAGRSLASFVCADQRETFARQVRRLARGGRDKEEWILRLEPVCAAPFEAALTVASVPRTLLWSLRDVTRRRRIERKWRQSEHRFRALYAEMLRHRDALRILSSRYLHAREEEAKRIAHELHDEAGQITAAIHLALAEIEPHLLARGQEGFRRISLLIEGIEQRLRRLSHELRPAILDDLGLAPALAFLGHGFAARTGTTVSIRGSTRGRLDPLVETAIYRIVQEALANVSKHARASQVRIRLERDAERLSCSIHDDGIGFDERVALRGMGRGAGLGLLGIQERLDALNGTMRIATSPGGGTDLAISVPWRRP